MKPSNPTSSYHRNGRRAREFPSSVEVLASLVSHDVEEGVVQGLGKYGSYGRVNDNGHRVLKLPSVVFPGAMGRGSRKDAAYYRVDHIIWALMTGQWPGGWIEHLNGILCDDHIDNLIHLDNEGVRWWYGVLPGESERRMVRVEDAKNGAGNGAAFDRVTVEDDKGKTETRIIPRVAEGWAERAREKAFTVEVEDVIEPAPDYERGEFGKDWT